MTKVEGPTIWGANRVTPAEAARRAVVERTRKKGWDPARYHDRLVREQRAAEVAAGQKRVNVEIARLIDQRSGNNCSPFVRIHVSHGPELIGRLMELYHRQLKPRGSFRRFVEEGAG